MDQLGESGSARPEVSVRLEGSGQLGEAGGVGLAAWPLLCGSLATPHCVGLLEKSHHSLFPR